MLFIFTKIPIWKKLIFYLTCPLNPALKKIMKDTVYEKNFNKYNGQSKQGAKLKQITANRWQRTSTSMVGLYFNTVSPENT